MLYIKSYVSGNGKNLVIKEAKEVECREYTIDIERIMKEYDNIDVSEGCDRICFNNFVEEKMKDKAKIGYNDFFDSSIDFEWIQNQNIVSNDELIKTFIVVSFINQDGEKCNFVPCGSTYIVNDKGSTIETIIKRSGIN